MFTVFIRQSALFELSHRASGVFFYMSVLSRLSAPLEFDLYYIYAKCVRYLYLIVGF